MTFGWKARVVGRRGAPAPRPAARGRAALAGGPARRRRRHAGGARDAGLAVRRRFCAELGLADPGISWLTARDRVAEFGRRAGDGHAARWRGSACEVYELQRPEIGELREPSGRGRGRQHHDAAQAQPRAQRAPRHAGPAGPRQRRRCCSRGWSAQHERDGRGWKAEWVALPGGRACSRRQRVQLARRAARRARGRRGRDAAQPRRHDAAASRCSRCSPPRLGKHAAQRRCTRPCAGGATAGRSPRRWCDGRAQLLRPDGPRRWRRSTPALAGEHGRARRGPGAATRPVTALHRVPGPPCCRRPLVEAPRLAARARRSPARCWSSGTTSSVSPWPATRRGRSRCCSPTALDGGADVLVTGGAAGLQLLRGGGRGRARTPGCDCVLVHRRATRRPPPAHPNLPRRWPGAPSSAGPATPTAPRWTRRSRGRRRAVRPGPAAVRHPARRRHRRSAPRLPAAVASAQLGRSSARAGVGQPSWWSPPAPAARWPGWSRATSRCGRPLARRRGRR